MGSDDGPTGRLNPLEPDDCRALFHQALERAGYPPECIAALRRYGDRRPRRTLPDGTSVIVQYVPKPPPFEKVWEAFQRLCAEQVNVSISTPPGASPKQRAAVQDRRDALLAEMRRSGLTVTDIVLGAGLSVDDEDRSGKTPAERIADDVSDVPDPEEGEAWNVWSRKKWKGFCRIVTWQVERYLFGPAPRQGERCVREDLPDESDTRHVHAKVPSSLADRPVMETPAWRRVEIRKQLREAGLTMRAKMPRTADVFLARVDGLSYKEIVKKKLAPTETTARDHMSAACKWIREHRPDLPDLEDLLVA